MAVSVSLNGTSYTIPQTGETSWGSAVTTWIQAVSSSTLQKSGGAFALTADANFGAAFGLFSAYFTSRTASAASSGAVRLANTDSVSWRNIANGGNITLKPDTATDGVLEYNGVDLVGTTLVQTLTNKTLSGGVLSGTVTGGTSISELAPAVLMFGAQAGPNDATACFLRPGYFDGTANTAEVKLRVPAAGKISKLYIQARTAAVGSTVTYTVRKNGVDTTLTCALLTTVTQGSDVTHSFTVAAGDAISVGFSQSGVGASVTADTIATMLFTNA